MADIFDLGVDFGLSYFKSNTEKKKVTAKEYNRNPIDFYNQSLEESTGIGVLGDPVKKEEEKEEAININTIGKPDEGSSESPNALDMNQMLGESSFVSKAISSELKNTPTDIMNWSKEAPNKTYGEALASKGYKDRSPSFKIFDTDFYSATLPKSGKDVKEGIKGAFSWESLAKKGLGYLGIAPFVSGVAGAFITGRAVPNALGKDGYRPDNSFLGGVFDAVNSIQYADVAINSAAINAYTTGGYGSQFDHRINPDTGQPIGLDNVANRGVGFNAEVGGHLVTRAAGTTSYTGGFASHETNKAVDALTKGYLPSTYNNKNETGERGLGLDSRGGMYSERGAYHYVGGIAASGSMQAARDLANKYGIKDVRIVTKALSEVRSQYGILGGKKMENPKTLSQILAEKTRKTLKNMYGQPVDDSYTPSDGFGVGSSGDLGGATGAGYSTPSNLSSASSYNPGGPSKMGDDNDSSSGGDSSSMGEDSSGGGYATAKGGFISRGNNFALGGKGKAEPAGFIEGPPEQFNNQTTIADDIPLTVKDGTFVLNAPAVENEGSPSVQKMLAEGYQKAMIRDVGNGHSIQTGKIPNTKELDIQISRGEVVIPPHVARAIGYDRLEKINNRGRREVERRQKAGNQEKVQAGQGFAAGDKVDAPKPRPDNLSSPYNDMKILGDLDLRADLEKYMYGNPVARIGWELYKNRELDIEAAIPEKETINYPNYNVYGVYGHYVSQQNLKRYKENDRVNEIDKHYMESLDPKIDERTKPVVKFRSGNYGVGKLPTIWNDKTNEEQLRILVHELSHAGINFLDTVRNINKKTNKRMANYEESLLRAGDSLIKKRTGLNVYNKRGINTTSYESYVKGRRQLKWDEKRWLRTSRFAQDVLRKIGKPDEATTSDDHRTWGRKFKNMLGFENEGRNKFNYLGFGTDSYDLDAQGRSDVDSQDAQNFADGGFVRKAAGGGGQFGVEVTPVTEDRFSSGWEAVKNKFKGKDNADRANKSRDKIAEVLKTFAPQEIMAFIAMSEASVLGDRGAEGTLHSLMNRVGSNVDDFKPLQDVYSAAVKRFKGQGKNLVFQFNGIEITDFRRYLGEMQDPNSYTFKKFNKYVELADQVMTGQRKDFTKGSTFFWNPKSNKSKSNFFAKGIASGRLIPTITIKGPDGMEHQHLKIVEDDVYERSQFPEDNYIDPKFAQKVGTDTKDSMFAQKVGTDTKDSMFAQKFNPKIDDIDPMFGQNNTTKKVEEDRSGSFLSNFIASQFQDNY